MCNKSNRYKVNKLMYVDVKYNVIGSYFFNKVQHMRTIIERYFNNILNII